MDPATINALTLTLKDSLNTPVSGTVGYSGMAATFTPNANLAYFTMYTATVTTGAKDPAGNPGNSRYHAASEVSIDPLLVSPSDSPVASC
jgi:Bacterial Ig-like domain